MRPIRFDRTEYLHNRAQTRALEQAFAAQQPTQSLMQTAGLAVARLALAVAPHAKTVWIACGGGNNGGDGVEAALHLQRWGIQPVLTTAYSHSAQRPADAEAAWQRAHAQGLAISPTPPKQADLCIDALLGIGFDGPMRQELATQIQALNACGAPVLAIDLPSGLHADTGAVPGDAINARWTLSLLTLKPGLFTACGRDHAGEVWFDDLHVDASTQPACAQLVGPPSPARRTHASHKGSYGQVVVLGGSRGMGGAALLAGRAALHAGAGRVWVGLLEPGDLLLDPQQPELMLRPISELALDQAAVVCGCGGSDSIAALLPRALDESAQLVLDADALNALSASPELQTLLHKRTQLQRATVLTPHPLEAARLLQTSTADVQWNRLQSAQTLAERFDCTVVLKGSGSVIAQAGQRPAINPTGNARLACAGTGDVLAGFIGGALASGWPTWEATCAAVYAHGQHANTWHDAVPLSASALARLGLGVSVF